LSSVCKFISFKPHPFYFLISSALSLAPNKLLIHSIDFNQMLIRGAYDKLVFAYF